MDIQPEEKIREEIAEHGFYAVMPKGTSMLPLIVQGRDTAIITPVKSRLKKYDIALYVRDGGSIVLHRVVRVGKSSYTFCGDHQYKFEKNIDESRILGVMTSLYKSGEEFDLNGKKYKREVRRRVFLMPIKRFYHGIFDLLHIHPTLKRNKK